MIKKILAVPLFLFLAFVTITAVLPLFGIKHYVVASDSMSPTIRRHALVYVNTRRKYEVGSIVALKSAGYPLLHRVDEIGEDYIVTKGDANDTVDPEPFPHTDVIGVMVFQIPLIGILFQSRYPLLIILSAVLLFIVGRQLYLEIRKKGE
jgi:signal peptidase